MHALSTNVDVQDGCLPVTNLPTAPTDMTLPVFTPAIPLSLAYPGLSPAQITAIVWAHRRLTLLIVVLVASLAALLMVTWPRTYTATVTLMVNYEINDPLNGKELPVGQVSSYIATQVELIQTPEVLLAVVDRLRLTQDKEYASGYRGDSGTLREWVARAVSKNLVISQGEFGSQLIHVKYSANTPTGAAQVANTVADVYREQDHMRSTGPPGERATRYAQQLNELENKVNQAQKQVTGFHQRYGLLDEGNKTNVDMALLATLEGRLLEAQNLRRAAQARAARDQSVNDEVLSSNLVQTLKTQLATQESQLAQLNTVYGPRHPNVLNLLSQLAVTQRALASAVKSYSGNAMSELIVAQRLEQNLQTAVAEQRSSALARGQLHDEAAEYLLKLASAQAVYKRALEGYDQIMFASAGHYSNISVVSRATPPVKASKPKTLAGLLLGAMAAAALGFGIPLTYELFHRRVRCRDDLERHHGVPVLVEFPRLRMASTV